MCNFVLAPSVVHVVCYQKRECNDHVGIDCFRFVLLFSIYFRLYSYVCSRTAFTVPLNHFNHIYSSAGPATEDFGVCA